MAQSLEQAIHERRRILGNQYAYLDELEDIQNIRTMHRKHENPQAYSSELNALGQPITSFDGIILGKQKNNERLVIKKISDFEIEKLAKDIQIRIWKNRNKLFSDYQTKKPIDMLCPIVGLELLGYSVNIEGALGSLTPSDRHASRIAGWIDQPTMTVSLATGFPSYVRNFTAAHELGHARLHQFASMHRDRPIDGASGSRDQIEREADKFAAFFLMPAKLVKQVFEELFGKAPFLFNEETQFALSGSLPNQNWQPKSLRQISRMLASATRFNGVSFQSLATQFRVSEEAMAIRLEQLELIF